MLWAECEWKVLERSHQFWMAISQHEWDHLHRLFHSLTWRQGSGLLVTVIKLQLKMHLIVKIVLMPL